MAKAVKKAKNKTRAEKYDQKLAVNGSFIDIMKAAATHAKKNSAKKQP